MHHYIVILQSALLSAGKDLAGSVDTPYVHSLTTTTSYLIY